MATIPRPSIPLPNPNDDMLAEQVRDWVNNLISFLEGGNLDEDNVQLVGSRALVGRSTAQTLTGLKTFENQSAAASGVRNVIRLSVNPASGTPAADDGVRVDLRARDAGGNVASQAYFDMVMEDPADSAVDSFFRFSASVAGSVTEVLTVGQIDTHVDVAGPARTHTADANAYIMHVRAAAARTVPAGTAAVVATMRLDEPNITATGTVTNAATLYISGAPTEGSTSNHALHVAAGSVYFASTLTLGGGMEISGRFTVPGTYDMGLLLGGTYVWEDTSNGVLRKNTSAPGSMTDGNVILQG